MNVVLNSSRIHDVLIVAAELGTQQILNYRRVSRLDELCIFIMALMKSLIVSLDSRQFIHD